MKKSRHQKIKELVDEIMERWETLSTDTFSQSIYCYRMLMNFTDSALNRASITTFLNHHQNFPPAKPKGHKPFIQFPG